MYHQIVDGQAFVTCSVHQSPIQKSYNKHNFPNDGISQYFGVWILFIFVLNTFYNIIPSVVNFSFNRNHVVFLFAPSVTNEPERFMNNTLDDTGFGGKVDFCGWRKTGEHGEKPSVSDWDQPITAHVRAQDRTQAPVVEGATRLSLSSPFVITYRYLVNIIQYTYIAKEHSSP